MPHGPHSPVSAGAPPAGGLWWHTPPHLPGSRGPRVARPSADVPGVLLPSRRVHISQSTLDCLKGEFDVEPGDGGSRCEYLDEKGIETYLIIASKPEVKKTAAQHGLDGLVSPLPAPDRTRKGGVREAGPGEERAGSWGHPRRGKWAPGGVAHVAPGKLTVSSTSEGRCPEMCGGRDSSWLGKGSLRWGGGQSHGRDVGAQGQSSRSG